VVTGGSQRVLRPGREGRHILTSVAEDVSPSGFDTSGNGQHGPRIGHDRRGLRSAHWAVPQVPGPPPARRQC